MRVHANEASRQPLKRSWRISPKFQLTYIVWPTQAAFRFPKKSLWCFMLRALDALWKSLVNWDGNQHEKTRGEGTREMRRLPTQKDQGWCPAVIRSGKLFIVPNLTLHINSAFLQSETRLSRQNAIHASEVDSNAALTAVLMTTRCHPRPRGRQQKLA